MSLLERQAELVDTHRAVQAAGLPYVLIGGWAVSAFQTRFTTDVDTTLPSTAVKDYDALLTDRGYEKQFENDVSNEYEGRMIQYTKPVGEHAVKFEALVDAMRCRQTPSGPTDTSTNTALSNHLTLPTTCRDESLSLHSCSR